MTFVLDALVGRMDCFFIGGPIGRRPELPGPAPPSLSTVRRPAPTRLWYVRVLDPATYVMALLMSHVMSYKTMLGYVTPCHTISYRALPCDVMSYYVIPYFVVSRHVVQCHVMSWQIMHSHNPPCHVVVLTSISFSFENINMFFLRGMPCMSRVGTITKTVGPSVSSQERRAATAQWTNRSPKGNRPVVNGLSTARYIR